MAAVQYYGTGRRKTSTARVFLRPGSGAVTVNHLAFEKFFRTEALRTQIKTPLVLTETIDKFDILVTVDNPDDEAAFAPALVHAGYELRVREAGHRMFRTPRRDVHVHVWADDDAEVGRYLALRDRLRASRDDRAAYERLKRELASRDWDDMNHYAEAKGELIEALIARFTSSP